MECEEMLRATKSHGHISNSILYVKQGTQKQIGIGLIHILTNHFLTKHTQNK